MTRGLPLQSMASIASSQSTDNLDHFMPDDPTEYRNKLEQMLSRGINVEGCRAALAMMEKFPPKVYVKLTPQETRIKELQNLLQAAEVDEPTKANVTTLVLKYHVIS
ncbi:hypothetical protein BDZ91DRAFT_724257 [Kalaharituber pfeilii]|nr:hypothetical protein BDZ91DRAFT_724257 [Kalaharituber pfeilii]